MSAYPRHSAGWYYAAKAEYEIRRQDRGGLKIAYEYLARAMDLGPNDWRSHVLMAKLRIMENRHADAVAPLRRAVALKGSDPSTQYLLARTLQRLGRETESRAAFKAYRQAQKEHAGKQRTLLVQIN
jgi:predicted Zn-dependent protease